MDKGINERELGMLNEKVEMSGEIVESGERLEMLCGKAEMNGMGER